MFVGALIDLGLPFSRLKKLCKGLDLPPYKLIATKTTSHGFKGTRFKVELESYMPKPVPYIQINTILANSPIAPKTKLIAQAIFRNLAEAEAAVHEVALDDVHFHEVGQPDAIVEIICAAAGLEYFKIEACRSSPVPVGKGKVQTAHGALQIPVPATSYLTKDMPRKKTKIRGELVTPTGAAILKTIVTEFVNPSPKLKKCEAFGIGGKDYKDIPNVLGMTKAG